MFAGRVAVSNRRGSSLRKSRQNVEEKAYHMNHLRFQRYNNKQLKKDDKDTKALKVSKHLHEMPHSRRLFHHSNKCTTFISNFRIRKALSIIIIIHHQHHQYHQYHIVDGHLNYLHYVRNYNLRLGSIRRRYLRRKRKRKSLRRHQLHYLAVTRYQYEERLSLAFSAAIFPKQKYQHIIPHTLSTIDAFHRQHFNYRDIIMSKIVDSHAYLERCAMNISKYCKKIIVTALSATAKHLATLVRPFNMLRQLLPLHEQPDEQQLLLLQYQSFIIHNDNDHDNDNDNDYVNNDNKIANQIKYEQENESQQPKQPEQHKEVEQHEHYNDHNQQHYHQYYRQRQQQQRKLQLTTKGLNKYSWIFLLIYLNLYATVSLAGFNEKRLLHDLLDTYNTLERPVLNESDPLQLSFGLTLMQIIDVDEKNQLLVTNVWLKLEWNDMNLRWNTSDYGGIKDLRIPPHRIWKPDVLMYNSADEGFDGTYQTNVVVRNNGSCLYVPPGIFKSTCKIDITWFPFDDQRCEMKFGSWTYDGFQLDLQLQDETGGDISSYVLNGEWELLGVPGKRNEIYYNCCPEPYIDITFTIIIRRRTLYYFFNLIIPCVLIASMALLGFTLPPDSGEKLSLGVTILLSLTVFLNMVAETMPATSDAVPLLGTYFNCIMFMVASSVVSTILILNYHHRNADTHEMSEWIRVVFLCWLPWILRMHRPGRPIILDFSSTPCSDTSSERKHQILTDVELKERSSKSLLANVLDIDDDFRNIRSMTPGGTLPHNPAFYRTVYGQGDDGSIGPIGSTRMPDAVTHHSCIKSSTEYELSLILKEIRFITDQLRKEDEDNDIANDWKFAAMVVDRLCLIIFTMFAILATIAVLLSAPHIIVS